MKKLTKAFPHREGAGRADEVESGSFRQPSYNTCHCEPVVLRAANQNLNDCQWQSYLNVTQTGVALSKDSLRSQSVLPRSPLAPTLGELAAEPTERVKIALPAPLGHLSHRERQVALIRPALAGDARATFPMGEGFGERIATPVLRHWFAMTPYIPVCRKNDTERYPAACRIQTSRARIARRGSRLKSRGRTAWE